MRRRMARRWSEYLVKVIALIALFVLIALLAPTMPPLCLAILWAALSIAAAIGVAYHYVINKARNRAGLEDGGMIARFNSGRVFTLTVAFVVSALCVGGLILELPKWEFPEWIMLVAAVPLYFVIFRLMGKALKREYKPLLRLSRTVVASSAVLCAVLLLAFAAIWPAMPMTHYESMTDAFLHAKQPFANSPSALLADLGFLTALVDGLTEFAMSRVVDGSLAGYVVWRIVLCASTAAGVSTLIGTCSLELRELKFVFQPLEAADNPSANYKPLKRYIAIACALPVILVVCTAMVNAKATEVAETEGYTMVRAAIRERVGITVCVIDGKQYDYDKVQGLYEKVAKQSDELAAEREAALTPLINEAYDKRLENVDAYLDWYYSLPANYERLLQIFAGTIEDGMKEQFAAKINDGVDETALAETMSYYWDRSLKLKADIAEELAGYELTEYGVENIPEWLVVPVRKLESSFLGDPLASTQKFLDAGERMGLSGDAGVTAEAIAGAATEKILAKPFFKKIVTGLTQKLGAQGLLSESGTSIVQGVGAAIGLGVGFAGDFLFLKVDEALNREVYKAEIVSAIEESRAEMLDMVSAGPHA